MATLSLKLAGDQNGLELSIPAGDRSVLRPPVLSNLINHLIMLRAKMMPPATIDRPRQGDPMIHHPKSLWTVEALPKPHKGVALMIGHPGAGWSRAVLNPEDAKRLSHALQLLILEEETATRQ